MLSDTFLLDMQLTKQAEYLTPGLTDFIIIVKQDTKTDTNGKTGDDGRRGRNLCLISHVF